MEDTRALVAVRAISLFIALCCMACSAEDEYMHGSGNGAASGTPDGPGAGNGGSLPPSGGGGGAGGAGSGGSAGLPFTPLEPDECGGDYYDADPKQLDIYVMLDDSASMLPWWLFVLDAVTQFTNSPESAGIGMGMDFFGPESPCDPEMYAEPAVPIAPLPDNLPNIEAVMPWVPTEVTPTRPAMEGAVLYAKRWAESHPDSKVVIWLITDGTPNGCDSTVENVAEAAAEGLQGPIPIETYVVGIGDLQALDAIAQAGGTGTATIIDVLNMGSAQALLDTMNELREAALPCDYALPTPDDGGRVDPGLVNLHFAPTGGQETVIPNVSGPNDCDPALGGWYYDDADNPARIIACDDTCRTFKSVSGSVSVILGCETERIE